MTHELTDRQRRILAGLIAEFVEQGEPVSSAWLAEHSAIGLSSASVRSILATLEEQGLVRQPHTSAGRVPTDSGYRQYVDWLLETRKRARPLPEVEARLRRAGTVDDLLGHVSSELSRASHAIGFALASADGVMRLKHIDFVSLDTHRVLVIVVSTSGQITHKVIDAGEHYESVTLTQAANYINAEFAGRTLPDIRAAIVEHLQHERMLYDALVARALRLARTGLADVAPAETLHVQGASLLIEELTDGPGEQATLETLRALFRLIEQKHGMVALLTRYLESAGLTVVIGSEHSSPDLRSLSLVTATYQDGERTGTVGVIGPTRMRYQRTISIVEGVAQAMTRVLEGQ